MEARSVGHPAQFARRSGVKNGEEWNSLRTSDTCSEREAVKISVWGYVVRHRQPWWRPSVSAPHPCRGSTSPIGRTDSSKTALPTTRIRRASPVPTFHGWTSACPSCRPLGLLRRLPRHPCPRDLYACTSPSSRCCEHGWDLFAPDVGMELKRRRLNPVILLSSATWCARSSVIRSQVGPRCSDRVVPRLSMAGRIRDEIVEACTKALAASLRQSTTTSVSE